MIGVCKLLDRMMLSLLAAIAAESRVHRGAALR
jgi:hypothetical protein